LKLNSHNYEILDLNSDYDIWLNNFGIFISFTLILVFKCHTFSIILVTRLKLERWNNIKNCIGSNPLMKTMLQIGEDQIQFVLLKNYKYLGEFKSK
jgi:hypothetical protein